MEGCPHLVVQNTAGRGHEVMLIGFDLESFCSHSL